MGQLDLMSNAPDAADPGRKGGPPNRMNDLPYREWMKFQKSFFRHQSDHLLLLECIHFFTKAVWPGGSPSQTLIIGFDSFDAKMVSAPRQVKHLSGFRSLQAMTEAVEKIAADGLRFDFLMADTRLFLQCEREVSEFLGVVADRLFSAFRSILHPDRYCGVVAATAGAGGDGFPLAWAIAQASRGHLRLRDEKIGLMEKEGRLFYCLFMQAKDDERTGMPLSPSAFHTAKDAMALPGWVIPKPPPRKKNEILHPAKYPETLVEEFIELFTKPGDTIIDPMVGTGSSVVAAIRRRRNGVGVDLSPEFAGIAAQRVANECGEAKSLFGGDDEHVDGLVVQGDSTKLGEIPALAGRKFQYAVTSPPYWSMLTNPGSENQESRRQKNLPLVYSQSNHDLGNVEDYEQFLRLLDDVYNGVADRLTAGGVLTVVVKNVKRNHVLYALAWDLSARLCGANGKYDYLGTTFWCQDDVGLKPFAVGIHWVSNILHTYCLHYRKRV
jgi:DNA modification methylase